MLLKEQGQRVFETLLFDIDRSGTISIYIEEVNMHHKIKIRDDPRIDSIVFFEDELVLVAHIKQYNKKNGAALENFKSIQSLEGFLGEKSIFAPEEVLIFKIFDKIKVRVDTTTEFPLDIKCTLVFGIEDL